MSTDRPRRTRCRKADSPAGPTTYVALLRGINVGDSNIIRMADLKKAVEQLGLANVSTYIQSGNVIFDSAGGDSGEITARLEEGLSRAFATSLRVVVRSREELKAILADVPDDWNVRADLRCTIAFIRAPVTAGDVLKAVAPKDGIDSVKAGRGVLYMSTVLSGLTKSGLKKLFAAKVYGDVTIRSYSTARKVLALMEQARPPTQREDEAPA